MATQKGKTDIIKMFPVSGFWFPVSGFWFLVSGFWFLFPSFYLSTQRVITRRVISWGLGLGAWGLGLSPFITVHPAVAQNLKFEAAVSKNRVAAGEQFTVTFTVNASVSNFSPPSLSEFRVFSGPNQSNSMQYINGNLSQSVSFSYVLAAQKEGQLTIGSAMVTSGGNAYKSNPISIEVVKGSTPPPTSKNGNVNKANPPPEGSNENIFLDAIADKKTVYQGEQINITFTIYFNLDIVSNEVSKLPEMNGFWTQDVKLPQQARVYTVNRNGVRYQAADLKKTVLFPQRSGNLEIGDMQFKCVLRTRAARNPYSIFDNFFGGYKDVEYLVKSKTVKIKVLPLPEAGKPFGINGAVGNFSFNSSIDKNELQANDAVNLTLKITGKGNLKLIEPVPVKLPPDFDSYDPRVSDNITTNESGVSGSRTFEYLFIPRHPGEYRIEPVNFSYFDPVKKTYLTLSSPEYKITVTKGNEEFATTLSTINKENVNFIGSDIMFIKNVPFRLQKTGKSLFLSPLFYAAWLSPLLFLALFLIIRKKKMEQNRDIPNLKRRRAAKLVKKRLAVARLCLLNKNSGLFYQEVLKGLWGYIGDKLNVPVAELSKESIKKSLSGRGVSDNTIEEIIGLLNRCEFAQYAPSGANTGMDNDYKEAAALIGKTENEIRLRRKC